MAYEAFRQNAESLGRPLRVLISAYACEPERGSEQAVGWNSVCQAARFHEVWAITREKNRAAIEATLARQRMPNVHWVYFDLPRWARFWKDLGHGMHAYYYLWQLGAYFVARKLHRKVGFGLVHHVTLVNYWMPSLLALLPVPFIWGPVGGGESAPHAFRRCLSVRGRLYEGVRDFAQNLGQLDPFVRLMAKRAALGIATTAETAVRLRSLGCPKVTVLSQVGLPADEIVQLGAFRVRQSSPFRLVSIGNLLHLKGFELGLRAFARFQSRLPATEYWIIGDGPERKRLERVAREFGVARSVTFWGTIPRCEVLEKLGECDALVHPSLHDSGGLVCVEAMAAGRPVICLDLGGPALQVTAETGIKVPAVSPELTVSDLAAAMERLALDPGLRARMAQAGRERVTQQFNWDRKGTQLAALCDEIACPKIEADLPLVRA
jgi:glycosyltransferase involved in cell wall biosynthesis